MSPWKSILKWHHFIFFRRLFCICLPYLFILLIDKFANCFFQCLIFIHNYTICMQFLFKFWSLDGLILHWFSFLDWIIYCGKASSLLGDTIDIISLFQSWITTRPITFTAEKISWKLSLTSWWLYSPNSNFMLFLSICFHSCQFRRTIEFS